MERAIEAFVQYYNQGRYHESLDNVTPTDMYYGRYHEIINQRAQIKQQTLQLRRYQNLNSVSGMNQAM